MASVYKRAWTGQDGRECVRWVAAYKDQHGPVVAACYRHTMTLSEAQAIFAGDWRAGYCRLIGGAVCAGR